MKPVERRPIVLDCTLRDGGYYNHWNFGPDLARKLLQTLEDAGVEIVELGYKSVATNGSFGLHRYCDEERLAELLPAEPTSSYAFMLDAKEFLNKNSIVDTDRISACVRAADESLFDWCRVATHPSMIRGAATISETLKAQGYRTALNIMGISTLTDAELERLLRSLDSSYIDVLYLADSYGSLTPEQTVAKLHLLQRHFQGSIGVHMHESQGLALANTLAALGQGVDFVDATVAGMGRGAGNLRIEQLLLMLNSSHEREDYTPAALLPLLRDHFTPLQQKHGWGWDFSYMLSSLAEIHPTYCQELRTGARYDAEDVINILEEIPTERRARFDECVLMAAIARVTARRQTSHSIHSCRGL